MSTPAHTPQRPEVPVGDRLAVRAGTGAALMVAWLVVGPRMPDTSVDDAVTWYLATAGIFLALAMWTLLPWLRAEPDDPRPEQVALPVETGRRPARDLTLSGR